MLTTKEHPILFSGQMVQAILAGRKSQTRRIIKPQPKGELLGILDRDKGPKYWFAAGPKDQSSIENYSPFGKLGDLLWVRETWAHSMCVNGEFIYKADNKGFDNPPQWKPSLFMPKEAARLWLRITDVRVERLQDISEEDAVAEGIRAGKGTEAGNWENYAPVGYRYLSDPVDSFRSLWESINGENSWNANPFVWVIQFDLIKQ